MGANTASQYPNENQDETSWWYIDVAKALEYLSGNYLVIYCYTFLRGLKWVLIRCMTLNLHNV